MRRKRFTEEQIVSILKESATGMKTEEVCRRHGIRSRVRTAPLPVPSKPNERWSMDFMQDCLADGRRFRVLTIVDDFTRECPGRRKGRILTLGSAEERGDPQRLRF